MTIRTETPENQSDELGRETRASAALVLVVMALVVTISFVGLAIS